MSFHVKSLHKVLFEHEGLVVILVYLRTSASGRLDLESSSHIVFLLAKPLEIDSALILKQKSNNTKL